LEDVTESVNVGEDPGKNDRRFEIENETQEQSIIIVQIRWHLGLDYVMAWLELSGNERHLARVVLSIIL